VSLPEKKQEEEGEENMIFPQKKKREMIAFVGWT
jgi:hypothetical protein